MSMRPALPPGRMLEAISTLKNKLVDPEAFKQQADDFFSQTLAKVYARYQKILTERNGLDFDDLLMKAALLLENDSTVCRELSDRFQYLLIDEYQDTNHAQYRLAKALVVAPQQHLRDGRSRPVDLPVAGGRYPQHPGLREGLARRRDRQAGGELPQHGRHPAGGRQAHRLQPAPQGKRVSCPSRTPRGPVQRRLLRRTRRQEADAVAQADSGADRPRASPAGTSPCSTASTP